MLFEDKNQDGLVAPNADPEDPASEVLPTRQWVKGPADESYYYPFGMEVNSTFWPNAPAPVAQPTHDYLYNGKELEESYGLDWHFYGARMYDAGVGRFTGVDLLANNFVQVNPYAYVLNSPIGLVDPNGLAPQDIIITGTSNSEVDKFLNVVNRGLGGQYIAYTEFACDRDCNTVSGEVRLRIIATEGGGDLSKLSKGQQAFAKNLLNIVENQTSITKLEIGSGYEAALDAYHTFPGVLDIGDVLEFPQLDPSTDVQTASTQEGKLMHIIMEQYYKQGERKNRSADSGNWNRDHFGQYGVKKYNATGGGNGGATLQEDRVNGNIRVSNFRFQHPNGSVYEQKYRKKGGGVVVDQPVKVD